MSRSHPRSVLALLAGTNVGRVITRQPTLEDAYVELVGQTESTESVG